MKKMKSTIMKAFGLIIVFTLICGVIYPTAITAVSQVFMKDNANGSIIEIDGKKYGSTLLAQQFTNEEYMWGRVMSLDTETYTDKDGNQRVYAGPSNLSVASDEYEALIKERVNKIRAAHPDMKDEKIPSDLVTMSGSGLDPEISLKAAQFQISRIADARGISEDKIEKIIEKYTNHKFLGILGEDTVNVLEVNLALEGILK